jgi:hypothetical protein
VVADDLGVSEHGDFFATPTVVATPSGTSHAVAPSRPPSRRTWLILASLVTCTAVVVGLFVARQLTNRAPHGPSTGLQATTRLHVSFPASVDGYTLQSDKSQGMAVSLSFLTSHVPALTLSTQVQYSDPSGILIIAGGPLPAALRFAGNAAQATLLEQMRQQISGPHGKTPEGWESKPTGALGGQLWCGTPKVLPSSVDGLCYAVDSQNVLIITTLGADASVAQQIRPLVEVTSG